MDKFSILGIITLIVVFISLLFAFFLLTVKTQNKAGNRLMSAYFIVFALHISVFFYAKYFSLPLVLERLRDQIMFLASPLLYLYVISAVYSDFKLRGKHLLHLLPFIVEIMIYVPRFYGVPDVERAKFMEVFHLTTEVKISSIYGMIVSVSYLVLIFITLHRYRRLVLENYSFDRIFNYKWLYQLTLLLSFIFLFSTFKQVYKFTGDNVEVLNVMRILITLFLLGFLSWIVLKSMYYPQLFRSIDTRHQLVKNLVQEKTLKSGKASNETASDSSEEIQTLRNYMEREEPYLDSSLTIQKLADQMDWPFRELSILINHHIGQHFFDFINEYRIKKAIRLLEDPTNEKLTVLEILYDVGFNSKSPFNAAFKKHTGMTPTQYRKSGSKTGR